MSVANVLILGIGNILWADEGFGVRVVQALRRGYRFPAGVSLMDGGTQGLALLPYVQAADTLVIADAVDFRLPPGSLLVLRDAEVPAYLGAKKMSLHQTSFQEVLALCQLMDQGPKRLLLVGVQPEVLEDYGGSLSPAAKRQIPAAIGEILGYLAASGICARPLPAGEHDGAGRDALGIEAYESLRPSPAVACRHGDSRFLQEIVPC